MAELQTRTFAKVAGLLCLLRGLRSGLRGAPGDTSMGKSDKKVRAESINKLRKQYDAFLEEDRKRKERNEDILSKLDKMRSTVTRYKDNVYNDQRSPIPAFSEVPTNIVRYNEPQVPMQLDIRSKHADETYLLNEISKKYILIPKTRPIIDNDYIPRTIKQDNNNDSDWKSKYSILDKLKQNEKEEENNSSTVGNVTYDDDLSSDLLMHRKDGEQIYTAEIPIKEPKSVNADKFTPHPSHGLREYQGDESVIVHNYKNDRTEKTTLPRDKSCYETNLPANFNDAYNVNNYKNKNAADTNNIYRQLKSKNDDTKILPPDTKLPADKVPEKIETIPQKNASDYQNIRENDGKYETEGTEKQRPELLRADSNTKVAPPVELAPKTSDDSNNVNYPIDVINVKDFTPNDDVTLVDGVNINPDCHDANAGYYASSYQHAPEAISATEQDKNVTYQQPATVTENITPGEVYTEPTQQYDYPEEQNIGQGYNEPAQQYVNPEEQNTGELYNENTQPYNTTTVTGMENVLGIQAFEAEQNEMFYSEQHDQNYEQYNQGDDYNAGYTGSTEGYDPATYYESTQQESYPVEVNEHEETSQRYDPSYEQQYVAPVAEDGQYPAQAEYQQAPNDQEVLEPTFMEHDPSQYNEQLSVVDQVQQQLDDEAGYYVQGPAENAPPSAEGSAPHQPTPDQTLTQTAAVVPPEKET